MDGSAIWLKEVVWTTFKGYLTINNWWINYFKSSEKMFRVGSVKIYWIWIGKKKFKLPLAHWSLGVIAFLLPNQNMYSSNSILYDNIISYYYNNVKNNVIPTSNNHTDISSGIIDNLRFRETRKPYKTYTFF